MEITLEQVERLRQKANVSYGQAKQALEYSDGNLLDALIYLEEQGTIPRPEDSYHSTKCETSPPRPECPLPAQPVKGRQRTSPRHPQPFHRIRHFLLDNELEIWRLGHPITAIPLLILIIFILGSFYITIPLLILGLFFGFRYQISGPDLDEDTINGVMDNMANTASDMGRQVVDELKHQHTKYYDRRKRP